MLHFFIGMCWLLNRWSISGNPLLKLLYFYSQIILFQTKITIDSTELFNLLLFLFQGWDKFSYFLIFFILLSHFFIKIH